MSDHIRDRKLTPSQDAIHNFNYPWAAAPDIIRSNQKDTYFQSILLTQLSGIIRSLYGARTAHNWTNEARTFTELLYLGLTTFVGNRTLGEEYCDIVHLEDDTGRLPNIFRRGGYILSTVLLPYILSRFLPALRRRLRAKLETSLRKSHARRASSPHSNSSSSKTSPSPSPTVPPTFTTKCQSYILSNLDTLTSPSPLYALSLATFYFTGTYYHLSKRLLGLRYTFTRRLPTSPSLSDQQGGVGYEVLGVLLLLQMAVQSYLHLHSLVPSNNSAAAGGSAVLDGGVEISTEPSMSAPLLFEAPPSGGTDKGDQRERVARLTHTVPQTVDLGEGEGEMAWIGQRKCTLCLEPMKDPAATTCGHVFCWDCVTEWLREQPMCPLCRQGALVQHVLPLRG